MHKCDLSTHILLCMNSYHTYTCINTCSSVSAIYMRLNSQIDIEVSACDITLVEIQINLTPSVAYQTSKYITYSIKI